MSRLEKDVWGIQHKLEAMENEITHKLAVIERCQDMWHNPYSVEIKENYLTNRREELLSKIDYEVICEADKRRTAAQHQEEKWEWEESGVNNNEYPKNACG